MNEEQLLKRKIIDTANQAFNHNIYTYTNFLSINELSYVNKMSNELSFIPYDEWGGNPVCERKIIRFGSEELYGYDAVNSCKQDSQHYLNYPNKPIIRQIC